MQLEALSFLAACVSTTAAFASAIVALLALREVGAGRCFEALYGISEMVRTETAREARKTIYDFGRQYAHCLDAVQWDELNDAMRGTFESQAHVCDYIGHLIASGLLKGRHREVVLDMWGGMLVTLWGTLGPYVRWRRERQGIGWQRFFQDAAVEAWVQHIRKSPYEAIRYFDGCPAPRPARYNPREKSRIFQEA